MRVVRILVPASILAMTACRGKLVATAELRGAGNAEARFHSTGAPLVLWADTDGTWRGYNKSHFPAHYDLDVLAGGSSIGHVSCDTKDSRQSVCGVHVSSGDTQRGDCELKLACRLPVIPAGDVVLRVKGTPGSNATEVKKLSINVRDE